MSHDNHKSPTLGRTPRSLIARKDLILGNRPFIDFINSAYCPQSLNDPLSDWHTFTHFLVMISAIDRARASNFIKWSGDESDAVLDEARNMREDLHAMGKTIAEHSEVPEKSIRMLNSKFILEDGGWRISDSRDGFMLSFEPSRASASQCLTAIARSTADFLCHDQLSRFRKCANADCPLYFYDISKNGRRRWCRMEVCGNRAKAAEHYQRSKISH